MAKVRKLFKFHKSTTDLSEWNKNDDKLLKAVEHGYVEKVEALLARKTLIPTKPGPRGLSVFHLAASSGQLSILEQFLANGVDVNCTDLQGHTALHLASKNGCPEVVQKLLQVGANQHALDSDHMTALHHACGSDHMSCVQILLQFEADVDVRDKSGRSALFYCAQRGDVAMCKLLIEEGADVNIQDQSSRSALIFAALQGHKNVCELLLKRGANPTFLDKEGMTAVEYSIRGGHNLQDVFDKAHARASWNVAAGADSKNKPGHAGSEGTSFDDAVKQFSIHHSPEISARLSASRLEGVKSSPSSPDSRLSGELTPQPSHPSDQRTMDAYKELEEEHGQLTEELRVLRINHLKLQDKVEFLQERRKLKSTGEDNTDGPKIQLLEAEVKKFKQLHVTEQEKNVELENKLVKMEHTLHNEVESEGSVGGTDSWGESEDELFGGPSEKKAKRRKADDEQLITMLRSQILTLRQDNDHLKSMLQSEEGSELRYPHKVNGGEISEIELKIASLEEDRLLSSKPSGFGLVNGAKDFSELQQENLNLLHEIDNLKEEMSNLKQSSLTNSVSAYSEGESGIIVNGELSRSTSEDNDVLWSENKKVHEECKGVKVTLERLQSNYVALVEAGDKLQLEYDHLSEEKSQIEQELLNISTEKDDLLKENEMLTTDGLHEDLERLVDELEKLQEKYKKVCKEKEELEKRPLNLTIGKGQSSSEMARVVDERNKLQQRCQELDETVTRVRHDHEIMIEEVQSLQEQCGDLQTERDQLQQEVELVQDELDRLSQQFDTMQQEYGQLEQDYAELLADKGKLEQDFLNVETSRARGESPDLPTGIMSLQDQEIILQQNSILSSEKDLLESKVLEFSRANEALQEKLELSKSILVELREKLDTLESSSKFKDQEVQRKEKVELCGINVVLEKEVKLSKSKMVELESSPVSKEKKLLESKVLELQEENEGLERKLEELKSEMTELHRKLDILESSSLVEKRMLENKIYEVQEVNEGLVKKLEKSKSKMTELHERLDISNSVSTEKYVMENQVLELKKVNEDLGKKLEQSKLNMADLQEKIDILESSPVSVSTEKELLEYKVELQEENDRLMKELEQSKSQLAKLQDNLESKPVSIEKELLENKVIEVQKENEGFVKELEQAKSKMADLQKKLESSSVSTENEFKGINEGLVNELEQSQSKMADFQSRLDTLESTSVSNTIHSTKHSAEKDKQIRSLQIKISRLQQQVAEMERKHRDTVNTYRTHLISAVQGHMDPDVRQALHHIIEIRGMEEYC